MVAGVSVTIHPGLHLIKHPRGFNPPRPERDCHPCPRCSQKHTRAANKNAKLPVSKAGGQEQDRCLHRDSSVGSKRTISVRSQKNQRKSGERAKDDGRAAGAPLPYVLQRGQSAIARDLHSRRRRLPAQ